MAVKNPAITLDQFARAFDEFFDELLIDRWRCGAERDQFEGANVADHPDRYEVRLAVEGVDPAKIDVEVHGQRLTVRAPGGVRGTLESSFSFAHEIDSAQARARWSKGALTIELPKRKSRRVTLEQS